MNTKKAIMVLMVTVFLNHSVFGMYHQKMGRFMHQDPLGIVPNDIQEDCDYEGFLEQHADGSNFYQYVKSNPLSYTDPQGKIIGRIYHCIRCIPGLRSATKKCRKILKPKRDECNSICDPWAAAECQEELKKMQQKCLSDQLKDGGILRHCVKCGVIGTP